MELKAGLWIAQGQATNILLNLQGKAPLLEVKGAIDLNHFEKTGETKLLTKNSDEVVDILSYPESYQFFAPAISDAIYNSIGLGSKRFEKLEKELTPEESHKAIEQYRSYLLLYGIDGAKTKLRTYLRNEFKLTMGQAVTASNSVIKNFKKA